MDYHGNICPAVQISHKTASAELGITISSALLPLSRTPHCRLDHRLDCYAYLLGIITAM